ncbi:MAG: phosphotransferase [Chloroflexi bacterium]|jgi:Ser/Thr protein kinase RdoA (MazF antagonist)|nr:phosphotransferase [Chloroflexota bacterium]
MSTDHFPDPDMPDFSDIRLDGNVHEVPESVVVAYGLESASITPLATGSYNVHFRVDHRDERFDLRRSNRPSEPGNLNYEAEILNYLETSGFTLAPRIVRTKTGESNLWSSETGWTLFHWMGDGAPKGQPVVNSTRIKNASIVLAEIHSVGRDLVPDAARGDWPVFAQPSSDPTVWLRRAEALAERLGIEGDDLVNMAKISAAELASINFVELPEFMCHGDFRMRNLQFTGDDLTGVFDFDISMRASRLLDLGGAVTRFSPFGGDPRADPESGAEFLRNYHRQLPLSDYEIEVLPIFIRWRLLRDVVIYFDYWWLKVRDSATKLFDGVAEYLVNRAISH